MEIDITKTQVEDRRRKPFAMIDYEVIDNFLPHIGVAAFAVYTYLVRRAGSRSHCYPSHERAGADLAISEKTVRRSIKTLADFGLLKVTQRRDGQRNLSNLYSILEPDSTRIAWATKGQSLTRTNLPGQDFVHNVNNVHSDLDKSAGSQMSEEEDKASKKIEDKKQSQAPALPKASPSLEPQSSLFPSPSTKQPSEGRSTTRGKQASTHTSTTMGSATAEAAVERRQLSDKLVEVFHTDVKAYGGARWGKELTSLLSAGVRVTDIEPFKEWYETKLFKVKLVTHTTILKFWGQYKYSLVTAPPRITGNQALEM